MSTTPSTYRYTTSGAEQQAITRQSTPTAWCVYTALLSFADATTLENARPGREKLAERAGVSQASATRALKSLKAIKAIEQTGTFSKGIPVFRITPELLIEAWRVKLTRRGELFPHQNDAAEENDRSSSDTLPHQNDAAKPESRIKLARQRLLPRQFEQQPSLYVIDNSTSSNKRVVPRQIDAANCHVKIDPAEIEFQNAMKAVKDRFMEYEGTLPLLLQQAKIDPADIDIEAELQGWLRHQQETRTLTGAEERVTSSFGRWLVRSKQFTRTKSKRNTNAKSKQPSQYRSDYENRQEADF